jgi:HPt (histidine-containing phosphotransfer) domain-containing protein
MKSFHSISALHGPLEEDERRPPYRRRTCSSHRAAHSLKSSSDNLGALALSGLCAELEAMCRMERMEGAPALVAAIEDEYDRVRAALELELDCSTHRHGDSGQTQGKRD